MIVGIEQEELCEKRRNPEKDRHTKAVEEDGVGEGKEPDEEFDHNDRKHETGGKGDKRKACHRMRSIGVMGAMSPDDFCNGRQDHEAHSQRRQGDVKQAEDSHRHAATQERGVHGEQSLIHGRSLKWLT